MEFPRYASNFNPKSVGIQGAAEMITVLLDSVGGLVATTKEGQDAVCCHFTRILAEFDNVIDHCAQNLLARLPWHFPWRSAQSVIKLSVTSLPSWQSSFCNFPCVDK